MTAQTLSDMLRARFGDAVTGGKLEGVHDPWIAIAPGRARDICALLRDDPATAFDVLMCLSGMDYGGGKLGVVYHLDSTTQHHRIVLKTEVTAADPHVASVESVWKTANWHEREAFDLFGVVFDGHPDLRRILMPDDWEGFPLRKDFRVPEFYNGMKVPY
ncbi:MAG TPA: NADH-quinone oxidoreductase subunit C [Bacteroidota bacterium]|nr:NADH-quinone oxidoreductase subunit C [Bacteroidota bacterium]